MTENRTTTADRKLDDPNRRKDDLTQGGVARRGIETGVPGPEGGLNSINRAVEEIIDKNADEEDGKKRD